MALVEILKRPLYIVFMYRASHAIYLIKYSTHLMERENIIHVYFNDAICNSICMELSKIFWNSYTCIYLSQSIPGKFFLLQSATLVNLTSEDISP